MIFCSFGVRGLPATSAPHEAQRDGCVSGSFFAKNSFVSRKFPARSYFRAGFFWPGELSFQTFFRFSTFMEKISRSGKFHGQKKYGFSGPPVHALMESLRRGSKCVAEFKPFFPTFVPVFFGFFEFQPENFPVFQISNRKKSGQKNFAAKKIRPYNCSGQKYSAGKNFGSYGRDVIGWKMFRRKSHPPS